ncbi:putative high-affinity branched chain amino acid ABC transporter, amino acid-binding protein [Parafrankia sp. EAN1pec]|uniref:ABC transporter substrate-binding protein n=1 Tax=Parafrankia sp. (strain EAN1pec) TaxID=298653 RepID=UPI0000541BDA|nr:putative high-affinity branched chain amino acid ABC transporter, amino acid-binding protein [Frankia sp. EAN1pec]
MMRRTRNLAVLLGLATALTAACGSAPKSDTGGGETGAADAAALGPVVAAPTGTPLVIGYISQENTAVGSYPEALASARAAADYINKHLGGVHGRPLELSSCVTDGSVATSANCARQIASTSGVVAASSSLDFGAQGAVPVLQAAGIPRIGGIAIFPEEASSPTVFNFAGGSFAAFPAIDTFVATVQKAGRVSALTSDTSPGIASANDQIKTPLQRDLGYKDVPIVVAAPDAADLTGALTQLNASKPDAVVSSFGQACVRIMQAKKALALPFTMYHTSKCLDERVLQSAGEAAEGHRFNSETRMWNEKDDDAAIYRAAMAKYASGTTLSNYSTIAFQGIMNTYRLLNKMDEASLTPKALVEKIRTTSDEPSFLGWTYTCDPAKLAVAGQSGLCSTLEVIVEVKNGVPTTISDPIDGSKLLRL